MDYDAGLQFPAVPAFPLTASLSAKPQEATVLIHPSSIHHDWLDHKAPPPLPPLAGMRPVFIVCFILAVRCFVRTGQRKQDQGGETGGHSGLDCSAWPVVACRSLWARLLSLLRLASRAQSLQHHLPRSLVRESGCWWEEVGHATHTPTHTHTGTICIQACETPLCLLSAVTAG